MSGAELLPDPLIVTLYGERVLVMHGDALCTDDRAYQRLRATVRDTDWQQQFLALSVASRRALAGAARVGSQSRTPPPSNTPSWTSTPTASPRRCAPQAPRRCCTATPTAPPSTRSGRRPSLQAHRARRLVRPGQPAAMGPKWTRAGVATASGSGWPGVKAKHGVGRGDQFRLERPRTARSRFPMPRSCPLGGAPGEVQVDAGGAAPRRRAGPGRGRPGARRSAPPAPQIARRTALR